MGIKVTMPCPKCKQNVSMDEVGTSKRSKKIITYQCSSCFATFEVGEAK